MRWPCFKACEVQRAGTTQERVRIEGEDEEKQRRIYSEGCLNAINIYCKPLNALLFKHCIKWNEKKSTLLLICILLLIQSKKEAKLSARCLSES